MLENFALPFALVALMLGLGMTLTREDFARVAEKKWIVPASIGSIYLAMPVFAWCIGRLLLPTDTSLSLGLILLAVCPGGMFSNMVTHWARGNVALSVGLTVTSTLVYAFAAPIVVLCALGHPAGALGGTVSAMLRMVAEVAGAVIVPLLAGMSIRRRYPRVSALTETPLRTIAALLVVVVFGWFGYEHLHSFESAGLRILGAVVLLNSAGWFMAALLTLRFRLSKREFIAVGVEHSIRQEGVGVFVAISVMGMPQIVPPLIVNSLVGLLVSFIVNAAIAARMRERRAARPPSPLFIEPD